MIAVIPAVPPRVSGTLPPGAEAVAGPPHVSPPPREPVPAADGLEYAAGVFAAVRPRLLTAAYHILGSQAEAEDVVQDTWLRWHNCDRRSVVNPLAFLLTVTRRIALNTAQSARSRHETCQSARHEEHADHTVGPDLRSEVVDAIGRASGVLMARLGPSERAAFVLREAFDYPYADIAALLGTSEVNARQLVSRAGRRLIGHHSHDVRHPEQRRLTETLLLASRSGEIGALEGVLLGSTS